MSYWLHYRRAGRVIAAAVVRRTGEDRWLTAKGDVVWAEDLIADNTAATLAAIRCLPIEPYPPME